MGRILIGIGVFALIVGILTKVKRGSYKLTEEETN